MDRLAHPFVLHAFRGDGRDHSITWSVDAVRALRGDSHRDSVGLTLLPPAVLDAYAASTSSMASTSESRSATGGRSLANRSIVSVTKTGYHAAFETGVDMVSTWESHVRCTSTQSSLRTTR